MKDNPYALEPGLPEPFHFRFRGDLAEELCLEERFIERPANLEEAIEWGEAYGRRFDKNDPMRSIDDILSAYRGMTSRLVILGCRPPPFAPRTVLLCLSDATPLRLRLPFDGPLAQLYYKAMPSLVAQGFAEDEVWQLFFPLPGNKEHRFGPWSIGYERETGHCAILESLGGTVTYASPFRLGAPMSSLDLQTFR